MSGLLDNWGFRVFLVLFVLVVLGTIYFYAFMKEADKKNLLLSAWEFEKKNLYDTEPVAYAQGEQVVIPQTPAYYRYGATDGKGGGANAKDVIITNMRIAIGLSRSESRHQVFGYLNFWRSDLQEIPKLGLEYLPGQDGLSNVRITGVLLGHDDAGDFVRVQTDGINKELDLYHPESARIVEMFKAG